MKYRHKLHIRHLIENTNTLSEIIKLTDILITELELIQDTCNILDNNDIILGELDDLITSLETVSDLCTEEIPEYEWNDYNFHGNYNQLLNESLNELYRIAGEVVNDGGVKYKFILIE